MRGSLKADDIRSPVTPSEPRTIERGLDLLDREQWRRTAKLDAWAAGQDIDDQAELRAAIADPAGE